MIKPKTREPHPDRIGKRLKAARDQLVLTQRDVAERSGIPETTISRLENGKQSRKPRQSTIQRLAEALGVNPTWLMWGRGAKLMHGQESGPTVDDHEYGSGTSEV